MKAKSARLHSLAGRLISVPILKRDLEVTGNCSLKKLAQDSAVATERSTNILLVNIHEKRTRLASKQKTFNFLSASRVIRTS